MEAEILGKTDLVDLTLSTSGFIKGEKLQNYINRKVGNRPMQQFPIKFAAVATDFESGKPVVFNVAMPDRPSALLLRFRTCSSLSSSGNRKYVDGGPSQPVPVSAAKKMGANFIIAVDISARPAKTSAKVCSPI